MINNINNFNKFYAQMIQNSTAYYKLNEDGTKTQFVTREDFINKFNDAWVEKQLDLMNPKVKKANSRTEVQYSYELSEQDIKETNESAGIFETDSFDDDVTPELTGIIEFTENGICFSEDINYFDEDETTEQNCFFTATDTLSSRSWEETRTSFEAFLNDCPESSFSMSDMMTTDTFTDNYGSSFLRW